MSARWKQVQRTIMWWLGFDEWYFVEIYRRDKQKYTAIAAFEHSVNAQDFIRRVLVPGLTVQVSQRWVKP